jgi:trehalose 6-phosphate phosphatase
VLVAFDFDGTLAPLAAHPDRVRMRAATRRLLVAVAQRYPCVVISGRSRADLLRMIKGVPVWHVAGNHGLEPWDTQPRYARRVKMWLRTLERSLAGFSGVTVEDKRYSVTVHYRHAADTRRAVTAIRRALATLRGARILKGTRAFSIVPRSAPHKGVALERCCRLLSCTTAMFVGDDDTDEDVFAAMSPDNFLGIRVGHSRRTRARYALPNQLAVDTLLRTLLRFRPLAKEYSKRLF